MGEDNLKSKALHGVAWTFLDTAGKRCIGFAIGIFLARLLSPSEYGLLGMIEVFITLGWLFMDSGFSQAMVRKPNLTEEDKLTAFWYSLSVGILIYVILFFSAPFISSFYKEPRLTAIIRVTCIPMLMSPFTTIPNITFTRDINFGIMTRISLVCTLISGIVGIAMAFAGYGVWALIFQQLIGTVLGLVVKNYYCRWHLRFVFSKNSFHYLWGFGNKMLLSGMIDSIYGNLYPIMIGKCFRANVLGQFQRAQDYSGLFSSTLTDIVQKVSFPTLSKMQEDLERMRYGYRKIIKMSMFASCTGCLALAAMAKPLIVLLIGAKWIPCTEYLQIICFGALLYPVHAINLNVLTVMGRSDLFLRLEIIKKIICSFPIIIGVFFGIKIMLCAGILSSFISFAINAYYSKDLINYSFIQQFRDILPYIIVSTIIGFIVWCITFLHISVALQLFMQIILFLCLTCGYYECRREEEYLEMKGIIVNAGHSIFNKFYK